MGWERERYSWDAASGIVTIDTLESNLWGPGSGWRSGKYGGQHPSGLVHDGRGVRVLMGVHASCDFGLGSGGLSCKSVYCRASNSTRVGGTHQPRRAGKTVMGA
jgi:hypothetical protein